MRKRSRKQWCESSQGATISSTTTCLKSPRTSANCANENRHESEPRQDVDLQATLRHRSMTAADFLSSDIVSPSRTHAFGEQARWPAVSWVAPGRVEV